jgi:hypothetical protein
MQMGAPPAGTNIASPPTSRPQGDFVPRFERPHRGDGDGGRRGDGDGRQRGRDHGALETPAAPIAAAAPPGRASMPAPVAAAQPMPVAAAPRPMPAPPAAVAAPAPAPVQHAAPQPRGDRGDRGSRDGNTRQQER